MGASESSLLQRSGDEITTISQRSESIDPVLDKLRSLQIANPILESLPAERSLTDILVRKPLLSSNLSAVDPQVLLELFSMYRDWQEKKTQNISKRQRDMVLVKISVVDPDALTRCIQEEIENKIDVADALAVKLLQRFNYSVSAMKTSSNHLSEVHSLKVELGELKGRLTEVISNCDALCKRIAADGPESLKSTVKPFVLAPSETSTSSAGTVRMEP